MAGTSNRSTRRGLSPEIIIEAAIAVADEVGIDGLTIRRLADRLGVQPMSIYHHLADKDAILDGIVDAVFARIERPGPEDGANGDWRNPLRNQACSARTVLIDHPWAVPLLESRRNPGPETLAQRDAVIGCLRRAGLSFQAVAHVAAVIDAFVYGFVIQESTLPATGGEAMTELAEGIVERFARGDYPYMAEMVAVHVTADGYDFRHEFDYGLDLILDGLELRLAAESER